MQSRRRSIATARLRLRSWEESHREDFARLHADPITMADADGPLGRAASDAKFDRYAGALLQYGISRWAVESTDGALLGYCGVMEHDGADHPLGRHREIGWRFFPEVWGCGYATESARAALLDAHEQGFDGIVSYTAPDNLRSQAVMARLGLVRTPERDVVHLYEGKEWPLLVWEVPAGG